MLQKSLILLSLFTLFHCSKDSEVLVSYKGGNITRKEFNTVLEITGIAKNPNLTSEDQKRVLKQLGEQKVIGQYMNDSGSKIPKELRDKALNLFSTQILMNLFKKDFFEKKSKNKLVEMAKFQVAYTQVATPEEKAKAAELLKKLQTSSESEIAKLIRENTQDESSKYTAGVVEPMCLNCSPNNPYLALFAEAIKTPGQFFSKEDNGRMFFFRLVKKESLVPRVLERYFESAFQKQKDAAIAYKNSLAQKSGDSKDPTGEYYTNINPKDSGKQYANKIQNDFLESLWKQEYQGIEKSSGLVAFNAPPISSKDAINLKDFPPTLVLLSKNDQPLLTLGQLQATLTEIEPVTGGAGTEDAKEKLAQALKFFYSSYYPGEIAKSSPAISKYKESFEFGTVQALIRSSLGIAEFNKSILDKVEKPSEQEIQATYEMGKLYAYSNPDPQDPNKRTPKPLSEVRSKIIEDIKKTKMKSIYENSVNSIKKDYQFLVNETAIKS